MQQFIASLIATLVALATTAKGAESRPIGPDARLIAYHSGRLFLASSALPGNVEVTNADEVVQLCTVFGIEVKEPKRTLTVAEALALAPKATEPKAVAIDPQKRVRQIRVIKR